MKKVLFVLCLLTPLALFLYGKAKPYAAEYKEAKQVTDIVRQIPMDANRIGDDFDHFPKATIPQLPPIVHPKVTLALPHKAPPKHTPKPLNLKPLPITQQPVVIPVPPAPQPYCPVLFLFPYCDGAAICWKSSC